MKLSRAFSLIGLSSLLASCSMMGLTERSYLSQMENTDDEKLFNPHEDFRVVPGDTGRAYRTKKEIRNRTPASASEELHEREDASLKNELARLEAAQSEGANLHYQQYRARLGGISERIYFLQLGNRAEREGYLNSRGLLDSPTPRLAYEMGMAAEQSELLLDMSKDDVISSWGRPDRIDVAGNPSFQNERWAYRRNGAAKYIYFEAGKVGGWTSN